MAMMGEEFAKTLIGLETKKAKEEAEKHGMKFRVLMEDGHAYFGTCDYVTNRINVSVEKGKVSGIINMG